jgi:cyclic 2,3-diphosphoglycerate synthetase
MLRTVFRPKPLSNIKGRKVFLAMTANPDIKDNIKKYMETEYGCKIIGISFNLSRRDKLRQDLSKCSSFDTILTELKAAAVDVLTEYASENIDNIPIITSKGKNLKKELMGLIGNLS